MLNGLNSAGNVSVICGNAASVEFQWKFNIGTEQSELAETSGRFRTRALRAESRYYSFSARFGDEIFLGIWNFAILRHALNINYWNGNIVLAETATAGKSINRYCGCARHSAHSVRSF